MGVPKFYRWISERYPCLSEIVREYQIPEFDNLYLDMNGIIHNCSHPNDDDIHFRISEEQVFRDIFRYIEFLFRMIKPRKVFFMAIDGVAPRAKMNQQRGRRFRSAQEAQKKEEEARKNGEELPKEARFDSNCITPGTEFMDRLNKALKWFVASKISTDDMWRNVRVILSGHETPGEGEHKIMDFIRYEKSQANYDPNTRHCLYGLDADLIVLGLCSHEPHFSLLREEVKFLKPSKKGAKNKNSPSALSRSVNPDVITFHLLHLSLLRNYLDHEFSPLKSSLSFPYDIEKVIDDWILMGFLVGNDFIPHIPHFHINKNSLPLLYKVYMDVLPTLDGYLNEDGLLNLERFEVFLRKVSEIDEENFMETFADLKYFESKISKKSSKAPKDFVKFYDDPQKVDQEINFSNGRFAALDDEDGQIERVSPMSDTEEMADVEDTSPDSDDDSELDTFDDEFRLHKKHYYETKLELKNFDEASLKDQAHGYIRALQWNLHYYYNGCVSWSWFYPHHYAPYISDVKDFKNVDMSFEMGTPFKPFEQLLAVLPAGSKDLLPKAYQRLLTDANSPIIHNYPQKFELDMNEKQQEWEAVVKINFIDEKELLSAASECSLLFSAKEKERNVHGPQLEFTYSPEQQKPFPSPAAFLPEVSVNHAVLKEVDKDFYRIPLEVIRKGRLEGARLDVHYPGFPTLFFIPHSAELRKERINVFGMASQGENMILTINGVKTPPGWDVAEELVGKSVFINWPHLIEAKVEKVADNKYIYSRDEKGKLKKTEMKGKELSDLTDNLHAVQRTYKERKGVVIGDTEVVLITLPITGRKYVLTRGGRVTLQKEWSSIPTFIPYQTIVKDIAVEDPDFQQFKTIDEIFTIGSRCFSLSPGFYGQPAEVVAVEATTDNPKVKVKISASQEPDLTEVIEMEEQVMRDEYLPNYILAQRLGMSGHVLSRLTGTIFVSNGTSAKVNIGLGLRFNTRNEEVPGFSRKLDDMWFLSIKVGDIIQEYLEKFPQVVEKLTTTPNKDVFAIKDLFPETNGKESLQKLFDWLKTLPTYHAQRQKIGAEVLDEVVVKYIEKVLNTTWTVDEPKSKEMTLSLKPEFLFRPIHYMGYSLPDPKATFNLYDRVVNVRSGISVPLGLKGVIIGRHVDPFVEVNTVYDVLFDEEFPGGVALRCSPGRGYKMSAANLINLTYGQSMVPKNRSSRQTVQHVALQPSFDSRNRQGNQPRTPTKTQNGSDHHQPQAKKTPQKNGGISLKGLQAASAPRQKIQHKTPDAPSRQILNLVRRPQTEPKSRPLMTIDMIEKEMLEENLRSTQSNRKSQPLTIAMVEKEMMEQNSRPMMTVEMLEESFRSAKPPQAAGETPGKRRVDLGSLLRMSGSDEDGQVKNGVTDAKKKPSPPTQTIRVLQRPKEEMTRRVETTPMAKPISQFIPTQVARNKATAKKSPPIPAPKVPAVAKSPAKVMEKRSIMTIAELEASFAQNSIDATTTNAPPTSSGGVKKRLALNL